MRVGYFDEVPNVKAQATDDNGIKAPVTVIV